MRISGAARSTVRRPDTPGDASTRYGRPLHRDAMTDPTPRAGETLDPINRDWSMLQLRRGHRFSTDDLVVAWRAWAARPRAAHLLDLGSGIGSVGLSTLWKLPPTSTLVGVEAQSLSLDLARRTAALNGLTDRVHFLHGDLRTIDLPPDLVPPGGFSLITGSPPYIPVGKGVVPDHPQKASARFELRGSVYDYCHAARRHLAPGGAFAFVMAAQDPRTEDAVPAADLVVEERLDVRFRADREPHICVLVCRRVEDGPVQRRALELTVRDAEGAWTEAYDRFRAEVAGLGPLAPPRSPPTAG